METTQSAGPVLDVKHVSIGTASTLDREYCLNRLIWAIDPIHSNPNAALRVAVTDATNQELRNELETKLKRQIQLVQLSEQDIRRGIDATMSAARETGLAADLNEKQRIELDPGQPPSKLVEDILATAVRMHATDIHIEVRNESVSLRFRIDGVMRKIDTALTIVSAAHVTNRLKVVANLDIVEHRRPQDGSITLFYSDSKRRHRVTFRISIIPGIRGELVAIRVLDPLHFEMNLDQLGMPPATLKLYRKLAAFPSGILLVTGPTGSGKSTTLYCTIREMEPRNDIKIMTIDDPVEYHFESVAQTHASAQMGFADALRAFLRQNADVLLVGEIRDSETAEVAIRAATTGHLILSTVHTKDAISALSRLRFLMVSDDYLASTVIGVVAQRLVRRICRHCKTKHRPSKELITAFYKQKPPQFFHGAGCEACAGTGYDGEIGLFELFVPDEELSALIASGSSVNSIRHRAVEKGFEPLIEDALNKVREGVTSLEEIARRLPPKYLF